MSHGASGDSTLVTTLDYIGLGFILVAIEEPGRRLFEGHSISAYGWMAVVAALLAGIAALYGARRIRNMPPDAKNPLVVSLDTIVHNGWTWILLFPVIIFGLPVTLYTVSPLETPLVSAPAANTPSIPPSPPRPKATIDELKAESGALLKIVEGEIIPIEHDWRNQLGPANQSPERMCIDLDGNGLRGQISSLTNRVQNAINGISEALKQSGIDQDEMRSLMGYPPVGAAAVIGDQPPLQSAHFTLQNYFEVVRGLGDKPTCQDVVMKNVAGEFFTMTNRLNAFNDWVGKSQQRLQKYQENLQKEARGAP